MNYYLPLARKTDILIQETEAETLVYDLASNKALCLNETSVLVWKNCDGTKTVSEIAGILENKLGKIVDEDLVWIAIDQLSDERLLENAPKTNKFSAVSRREVIKRIGYASMIAIPLVASISAPKAVNAQSCPSPPGSVPAGGACTQDCECQPGNFPVPHTGICGTSFGPNQCNA